MFQTVSFISKTVGLKPAPLIKKEPLSDAFLWPLRNFQDNFPVEHHRETALNFENLQFSDIPGRIEVN